MKRILIVVLSVASLVGGCRRNDDADLPPVESMYLPLPEATASSALTAAQGLCAEGEGYENLNNWVDAHNEHIRDKILLLRGLGAVTRRALRTDGEFEWSRTRDGRTISLKATVQEDDSVAYQATFAGPLVSEFTFLDGTTAANRQSGQWNIHRPDGTVAIEVTWERDQDGLFVERKVLGTDRVATFTREGTQSSITFSGTNHTASAEWNTTSKTGSFVVDGEEPGCFSYVSGEFCAAECAAE